MRVGWPAYRVVGKQLALVSKSAGQCTKRIFKALFGLRTKWRDPWDGMSDNTCCYVIAVNLLHR